MAINDEDKLKITKSTVDALNNQETFKQWQSPIPGISATTYGFASLLAWPIFLGYFLFLDFLIYLELYVLFFIFLIGTIAYFIYDYNIKGNKGNFN